MRKKRAFFSTIMKQNVVQLHKFSSGLQEDKQLITHRQQVSHIYLLLVATTTKKGAELGFSWG